MPSETLPALITTPPGRYRHYKGGLYEVIGTARHSETLEPMTIYRALYGEQGLWVRPAGMFAERVDAVGALVVMPLVSGTDAGTDAGTVLGAVLGAAPFSQPRFSKIDDESVT